MSFCILEGRALQVRGEPVATVPCSTGDPSPGQWNCVARLQRAKKVASSPTPPEGHTQLGAVTKRQNSSGHPGHRAPGSLTAGQAGQERCWEHPSTTHHPKCHHALAKSPGRADRTDLTFTMSAGVPTNPPVKPVAKEELDQGLIHPEGARAKGPTAWLTSCCSQQHFLVERGRPLVALAQVVLRGLIDAKTSQGICHLDEGEMSDCVPGTGQLVSCSTRSRSSAHSPAGTVRH